MEVKEAFHKWANGEKTLVAYGPRDEGGYSLLEYNATTPALGLNRGAITVGIGNGTGVGR